MYRYLYVTKIGNRITKYLENIETAAIASRPEPCVIFFRYNVEKTVDDDLSCSGDSSDNDDVSDEDDQHW